MKRKLKFFLLLMIFALVIAQVSFLGKDSFWSLLRLKTVEESLKSEIACMIADNNRLTDDIDTIKNDDFYVEKIARDELGLVRKGELVIHFD